MTSLLLCGTLSAQNYWGDDPNSHAQPSNTPIVATVQINNNPVTPSANWRLGAFIGDNLWGIAAPHTDGKFWIQVFYETANAEISFKLYDGSYEYTTSTTVPTSEAGDVVTLDFTRGQTVELAAKWNWWSTNLDITFNDLKSALENAVGNSAIDIKSVNGQNSHYNGTTWRGSLTSLDVTQMYKIQTSISCEITLTGSPINCVEHPVTINYGKNWIGFPGNENMSVATAFNGFAVSGDNIKSENGNTAYFNGSTWRGNLTTLEPGKGYVYNSSVSNSRTFVFPINQ